MAVSDGDDGALALAERMQLFEVAENQGALLVLVEGAGGCAMVLGTVLDEVLGRLS